MTVRTEREARVYVPSEIHDAPEHLSISQAGMLSWELSRYACPSKWARKYRLRQPEEGPPSPALIAGRAFDQAANTYFTLRDGAEAEPAISSSPNPAVRDGRVKPSGVPVGHVSAFSEACRIGVQVFAEEPEETWEQVNPDRLLPNQSPREAYEGLFERAFVAFIAEHGKDPVALVQDRHSFTIELQSGKLVPVLGYSDAILADGTIRDHKFSGSTRWNKHGEWNEEWVEEKQAQLLTYWLARAAEEERTGTRIYPPLNGKGELCVIYARIDMEQVLVKVKEVELELERGQELIEKLARAAYTIEAGRFPVRPGQACGFCGYVNSCRADQELRGAPFFSVVEIPF